jgi:hypothetical protein
MTRKVIIVAAILLVAFVGWVASNPLRRSETGIRGWLEKKTPLGSSLSEVRATATQHGWYDANMQGSDGQTTGTYIRGELGDYRGFPFVTSVTVFLGVQYQQSFSRYSGLEDDRCTMSTAPNNSAPGKAGFAPRLTIRRYLFGLPEPSRSATHTQ